MMKIPAPVFLLLLCFVLGPPPSAHGAPPAYVVNNGEPRLTIVDMGTRQVTGQINVGNQPAELFILPDNRFALLTEYSDNMLRKIDLRRGGSVETVLVGRGPGSVIVSPDSRFAYVANEDSNDVSVVDVAGMTLVSTIPVGITPIQVSQRPDGKFIYTVNQDSNNISVIDAATRAVVATRDVGVRPNQFAMHPAGQRAFLPNLGSNTVSVFDLSSNSVSRTITVPGREPAIINFSPDGNRIFVLNRASNTVDIFDNSAVPQLITSFSVGAQPTDIAVTSDGLFGYVACMGSNQVFGVDMTNIRRVVADPIEMGANSRPFSLAFDVDESFLYVVLLGSKELALIDTNTDTVRNRLRVGLSPVAFVQLNQPFVYPGGVVNGASFAAGAPVAGGAIVSLFGEGLVAEEGFADKIPLPTTLGGTQVKFNGVAAPLFFTSGLQINVQVPAALLGATSARMEVVGPNGSDVSTVPLSLAAVSPGIFSFTSDGKGPGAILHADSFAAVTSDNPARPGEIVLIFATGLGQTNPPLREGEAVSSATPITGSAIVTIGGQRAAVQYAGLAPGFAGLYQVNAVVPASLAAGSHNVILTVNGVTSNTVTLAAR